MSQPKMVPGLVHTAPAFGQEDMETGKKYDLPVLMTVLPDGTFIPEVTPWRGVFVKDADPLIIEDLRARGLLFNIEAVYTHVSVLLALPYSAVCITRVIRGTSARARIVTVSLN